MSDQCWSSCCTLSDGKRNNIIAKPFHWYAPLEAKCFGPPVVCDNVRSTNIIAYGGQFMMSTIYFLTRRCERLCRICIVQIQPRKRILDDARYTAPTRQHELEHTWSRTYLPWMIWIMTWEWAIQIIQIIQICRRCESIVKLFVDWTFVFGNKPPGIWIGSFWGVWKVSETLIFVPGSDQLVRQRLSHTNSVF